MGGSIGPLTNSFQTGLESSSWVAAGGALLALEISSTQVRNEGSVVVARRSSLKSVRVRCRKAGCPAGRGPLKTDLKDTPRARMKFLESPGTRNIRGASFFCAGSSSNLWLVQGIVVVVPA